jgi:hypothetical protein
MKKLLFILCFLPVALSAQIKTFSPSGTRISYTPSVSIVNSTVETTLFSDVIAANSLVPGKYYPFRVDVAVNTPLVNLATLTFRVKYGGQTIAVINGAGLTIGLTQATPITIIGNLVSRGTSSQFLPITVNQAMGNAISLTTGNTSARGLFTVDSSVDQTFTITAQFGGVGGNACTLVADWVLRSDY